MRLFKQSFRTITQFAVRSRLTMALTVLLLTALGTAGVYGFAHLFHAIGLNLKTAKILLLPLAAAVSWFGTAALNYCFSLLVSWFRGEPYQPPRSSNGLSSSEHDRSSAARKAFYHPKMSTPNGGWICSCGKMHPFYDTVCTCGSSRPEPEKEEAAKDRL